MLGRGPRAGVAVGSGVGVVDELPPQTTARSAAALTRQRRTIEPLNVPPFTPVRNAPGARSSRLTRPGSECSSGFRMHWMMTTADLSVSTAAGQGLRPGHPVARSYQKRLFPGQASGFDGAPPAK